MLYDISDSKNLRELSGIGINVLRIQGPWASDASSLADYLLQTMDAEAVSNITAVQTNFVRHNEFLHLQVSNITNSRDADSCFSIVSKH